MGNYLDHLQNVNWNTKTFQRKKAYIQYNFSKYFKGLSNNAKVLEIGPGFGEFVSYLNDRNFYYVDVIDNNKKVLEFISKQFKINNTVYFDIALINQKQALLKEEKYDIIFLLQVLEHVPKNSYKDIILSLYEHLNINGHIIITSPNGANPFNCVERYGDLQHENVFTEYTFRDIVGFIKTKDREFFIRGYQIPINNPINLIRKILQKIFHLIIYLLLIINGGLYSKILTPNICLIIKKK